MKKRNKHWERDKQYLRLLNDLHENWETQRNLGWVELEEPIPYGYNAFFVLRDDVSRRDDSWIFQTIIDTCGTTSWKRKNDFLPVSSSRNGRWLKTNEKNYRHTYPYFREIREDKYDSLPEQVKKWFSGTTTDYWGRKWYYTTVPIFYFEVKVEQNFKTKVRVIDEILLQEEIYISGKLSDMVDKPWSSWGRNAPKSYTKLLNRSDRAKSKQVLHNIIRNGCEKENFPYHHKHSGKWYW
jgi:hypothetical protein